MNLKSLMTAHIGTTKKKKATQTTHTQHPPQGTSAANTDSVMFSARTKRRTADTWKTSNSIGDTMHNSMATVSSVNR